ncbi:MAG: glycosyltransferase family 39 protein [Anaerolineae bacterium]
MSERITIHRWASLAAVTLLGAALRFWRLGELALIGDESYYWLWSRHLDWAYFDHPAGVAVMTWLSTALGGPNEAGIRWLNALLSAGCIVLVWILGARMVSWRAGFAAALMVAIGAPYLLTARFVYTDALHLFLLLLNLYCFWRLAGEESPPGLVMVTSFGVSLAALLNTKYSAYFYALALAVSIGIDHRHLLRERRFWLGIGMAALGLLPVVIWNAAHDWASFRWQLQHAGLSLTGESSLLGSVYHGFAYLSWPLAVLALLGLGRVQRPAERLLGLVALFLLLPVLLSPANSPRNLSSGLVPLLLLAGIRWPVALQSRWQKGGALLLVILVAMTAAYGVGTLVGLSGPASPLQSSAVRDIRRDAAGWREIGPLLAESPELVFALDYSIASQIWYYSGRPAYTSWGQYRIWGIPEFRDATVVSLDYLPEELVTPRLEAAFEGITGPRSLRYEEPDVAKEVRIWQAEGLRLEHEAFVQQFDFLTLLEASR